MSKAYAVLPCNDLDKCAGWIAEIELSDFESEKDLLLEFDGYFKIMKEKVDEYHV